MQMKNIIIFRLVFFIFVVEAIYPNGNVYLKLGSGSINAELTNFEISGDNYASLEGDGISEGYAEIGYKSSKLELAGLGMVKYKVFVGGYAGDDTEVLGGEYGIYSYGAGIDGDIPNNANLYYSVDFIYNVEFTDYEDFRVGSSGEVYSYSADDSYLGYGIGIGYLLNKNISLELKYKNHNGVHFSEFPDGVIGWWEFDYKRSGVYGLLNIQIEI